MSNTAYFIGLIEHIETVKTSTLLNDEERRVFARGLLKEIKPEMMTRGSEESREIIVRILTKLSGGQKYGTSPATKLERPSAQSEMGNEPEPEGSFDGKAESKPEDPEVSRVLAPHGPAVHSESSRDFQRKAAEKKTSRKKARSF